MFLLNKINRTIYGSESIEFAPFWKVKSGKGGFVSIKLGLKIRMCLFNVRRYRTGNHVRELARRPHEHPGELGNVCPGAKPNVERPINLVLALNSPVASELSICTGDYLFPTACPSSEPTCEF